MPLDFAGEREEVVRRLRNSIVTQTGDSGATGLLFNRRVSKADPRVEAYGACDELTSAIGLARAQLSGQRAPRARSLARRLLALQEDLVVVMGEVATRTSDRTRYRKAGRRFVTADDVARLTREAHAMERAGARSSGWAIPGANPPAAALDLARAICRRAERRVVALGEDARRANPEVVRYLNRLSDLLWLMARQAERRGKR